MRRRTRISREARGARDSRLPEYCPRRKGRPAQKLEAGEGGAGSRRSSPSTWAIPRSSAGSSSSTPQFDRQAREAHGAADASRQGRETTVDAYRVLRRLRVEAAKAIFIAAASAFASPRRPSLQSQRQRQRAETRLPARHPAPRWICFSSAATAARSASTSDCDRPCSTRQEADRVRDGILELSIIFRKSNSSVSLASAAGVAK